MGLAAALGITVLIAAVLAVIAAAAGPATTPANLSAAMDLLRMTALQAGISTVLSLLVGIAVAWALNRLSFPGRGLVVALFASAIVTPGILVAFGLLAVWGRAGWVNQWLAPLGLASGRSIYGLWGIVAAHVILDGAFAARILLGRLDAVPLRRLRTGQSLALDPWRRFRIIDWPAMRDSLPGLAAIIFLLAFTSFPIVLLLGGGPANQTFEVAIYAAVRLDFDLSRAVALALVQLAACGVVILAASALSPPPAVVAPSTPQHWRDRGLARPLQWMVLALALAGFGLPLAAILAGGIDNGALRVLASPPFLSALGTSVTIATASAALTLGLVLALGAGRAATAAPLLRLVLGAPVYAYLAVPAVVLSLGFFLLVLALGIGTGPAAPFVVVVANALLALPFALSTLGPPLDGIARTRGRLIRSLGIGGVRQFGRLELPLIGRELGVVLALAFCFSFGDLGVIALFGTSDFTTLPLLMYRALGAYRGNEASIVAAAMLVLTIAAFAVLPRLAERIADASR